MDIFKKRPLLLCEFCFLIFAFLSLGMSQKFVLVLTVFFGFGMFAFGILWFFSKKRIFQVSFFCILFSLIALLSFFLCFHVRIKNAEKMIGEEHLLVGTVVEKRGSGSYYGKFGLRVAEIDGESALLKVVVECEYASAVQVGDRIAVSVIPRAFTEEEDYDERLQTVSDGYFLICTSPSAKAYEYLGESRGLSATFYHFKQALSELFISKLGKDNGGLAAALLLGNRDCLNDSDTLNFCRLGVSHILALSGLHVSILIGFADFLMQRFRFGFSVRTITVPIIALFYLALTGFSPSALRAVLMLCFLYLGYAGKRDYDPLTALGSVLCLILFLTPYAIADLSLWLSFLATGGIIVFFPLTSSLTGRLSGKLGKLSRIAGYFLSGLLTGLLALLPTLTVSAFVFGEISLWSIPVTVAVSPLLSAALIFGLLAMILQFPFLWSIFSITLTWMRNLISLLSGMRNTLISVDYTFAKILFVGLAVFIFALAVLKIRKKILFLLPPAFALFIAVACIVTTHTATEDLSVNYLSTTTGDAILLSQKGRCALVNFSDGRGTCAYEAYRGAKADHCTEIEDLVFTHYHNRDTYFVAVLASKIQIRTLWLPEPLDENEAMIALRVTETAERFGIRVVFDTPETLVEDAQVLSCKHSSVPGRHEGVLFALEYDHQKLTYINITTPEGELFEEAEVFLKDSEILIAGDDGTKKTGNTRCLSVPSENCCLFFASEASSQVFGVEIQPRFYGSAKFEFS